MSTWSKKKRTALDKLTDIFACRLNVTFIDKEGEEHKFQVAQGDNLLDIAQSEELEMEGEPHMGHED